MTARFPVLDGYAGKYTVAFDPLDGSSNIDVNVSIGTIFSIHRRKSQGTQGTGRRPAPAGPRAGGGRLHHLRLQHHAGLHHRRRGAAASPSTPASASSSSPTRTSASRPRPSIYSVNEAYSHYWHDNTRAYVEHLKDLDERGECSYSLRYIGSLVADFHRNLIKGGVFRLPGDKKTRESQRQAAPALRGRAAGLLGRAGRRPGHRR